MAQEIERKFLIVNDRWRDNAGPGLSIRQGYLGDAKHASVRVRIEGEQANINIKGVTLGISRTEYEYPIPRDEALEMLNNLCQKPLIEKHRYQVKVGDHLWEVDLFEGDNAGLRVAEVELESEDQPFEKPPWVGDEVSDDARYYNVCLVNHPYKDWDDR
ncbi:MAG: CYTH domain-containing protein [Gammaproteobacteria bacterium]|nr:CYTH domain-containing protein [Gammaproteobacteria bacterium]MCF6229427.1 CYTH domain-containing protein [Gammaproteobacteria bacterium]